MQHFSRSCTNIIDNHFTKLSVFICVCLCFFFSFHLFQFLPEMCFITPDESQLQIFMHLCGTHRKENNMSNEIFVVALIFFPRIIKQCLVFVLRLLIYFPKKIYSFLMQMMHSSTDPFQMFSDNIYFLPIKMKQHFSFRIERQSFGQNSK